MEYNRNHVKRYRQAVLADPERHARYLESERMRHKMRQERLTGRVPTKRSKGAANAWVANMGNRSGECHVEPIAAWLHVVLRIEIPDFGLSRGDPERVTRSRTLEDLAAELQVSTRRLWSINHRGQEFVSLTTADAMLTNYGRPVTIDGDMAARALEDHCRAMPGNGERILRYIDRAERIAHLDGVVVTRVDDLYPFDA
jgi:hypothetical protein